MERLVVSHLASTPPLFSTVYQSDGCLSSHVRESSWLGHQVLPTISAIFILELAPHSGSYMISESPNPHIATQLLM